jgi:NADPH-dependent 2,4-dienoyl-CoA reductase/sulfur reductase-like enzyme
VAARLLVIGGDGAGMSAAAEARRADPEREIVVLERGSEVAYSSCGIPYLIAGEVGEAEDLVHHDPEYFRRERRIDVRTGAEAVAIDPTAREVTTADGGRIGYGALVVATGARPVRPPVPGADAPGVLTLRDLASARELEDRLRALPARPHALLVGSGPIGLEMAEALLARGARVTVIEALPRILPALAEDAAEPVLHELRLRGVALMPGVRLERIEGAPGDGFAATIDGQVHRADLVLLGTGVRPRSELAAAAGCALGDRGAIEVDHRGRTSVEGIWAAGDCATSHHRVRERSVWIPLATTANAQARVAARDIAGREARFAGVLGSWVSRFGDVSFGATGIDEATAAEDGFAPRVVTRIGRDRSGYMPGVRRITVRLVWDEPSGRLLGGQAAGAGEVATRLHTISVAVAAGMTVRELAECDFGYAPPVAPLRDPVELAAAAVIGDAP